MSVRQLWEGTDAAGWAQKLNGRTKLLFLFLFAILMITVDNPRTLFILFTFMTMIVTSSYNISYLINKFKHKEINIIVFIMHFILQCVFICDIIDTIYIYKTGENMIK